MKVHTLSQIHTSSDEPWATATRVVVRRNSHLQQSITMADLLAALELELQLTAAPADDRDYGADRDRSRSPGRDRDGDVRIRDEPSNGRDSQ